MIYLIFFVDLLLLFLIIRLSYSPIYGSFCGSAVHPMNVNVMISLLLNVEFVYIWWYPELLANNGADLTVSPDDIVICYIYYSVLSSAAAGAILIAHIGVRQPPAKSRVSKNTAMPSHRELQLSAMLIGVALASCVPAAVALSHDLGALLEGQMTFQVFTRENWSFAIGVSLLLPCLAMFLSVRTPWSFQSLLVAGLTFVALVLSGTRSNAIFAIVVVLTAAVANGIRISAIWAVVCTPFVAVFLTASRYALREGWNNYSSYSDFVETAGGYLKLFFGSTEIGMAKSFSAVVILGDRLSWDAFSTVLGMIMFPFPRSYFTFKPMGVSAYFTEEVAPVRWLLTKSEITITGYGDLFLSFGLAGGALAMFALAFFWQRLCLWAIEGPAERSVVWVPFLIFWDFLFIRTDLYNVASFVWPFALVFGIYQVLLRAGLRAEGGPTADRGA